MSISIKRYRKERGLTQRELAEKVNAGSSSVICMWETGKRQPDIKMIKALAAALGVTIDELLSEDE